MIPKIVHLSWKDKDLLDSESPLVHGRHEEARRAEP
jgi:hypothetical protein